jgi:hypothetical protein
MEWAPFKGAHPAWFGNPSTTGEENAEAERRKDAKKDFAPVSGACRGPLLFHHSVDQHRNAIQSRDTV